ncbi:MAG: YqaA family protein [Lysobacterales bacterium]
MKTETLEGIEPSDADTQLIYASVFASAFLAATILPFYSEIAVVAAVMNGYSPSTIWLSASLGNTLGAVVNAVLGRLLPRARLGRLLGVSDKRFDQAQRWFQRYGQWSLLLAWLPIGGDAITVVAGVMRTRWLPFVLLVFAGKSARYAVVIWLALKSSGS